MSAIRIFDREPLITIGGTSAVKVPSSGIVRSQQASQVVEQEGFELVVSRESSTSSISNNWQPPP